MSWLSAAECQEYVQKQTQFPALGIMILFKTHAVARKRKYTQMTG